LGRDASFQANLDYAKNLWQGVRVLIDWGEQYEQVMGRSVGHKLQVVGRILVVRRDVECHHSLQEGLRGLVVGEESVTVDVEELAL
jgi:hypothetical protein